MKIEKTLPTGVTTTQPKRGGRIEVKVSDYDTYYDNPSLESEYKAEMSQILKRIFKPQMQY